MHLPAGDTLNQLSQQGEQVNHSHLLFGFGLSALGHLTVMHCQAVGRACFCIEFTNWF